MALLIRVLQYSRYVGLAGGSHRFGGSDNYAQSVGLVRLLVMHCSRLMCCLFIRWDHAMEAMDGTNEVPRRCPTAVC